ncbi:MAG: hypothetical protein LBP51_05530, partial [Deferribacteraceae bacterium]|nr:hypothetical protein [Deferribacteraceae bacterium]
MKNRSEIVDTIAAPITPICKSGVILIRISGSIESPLTFFKLKGELEANRATLAVYTSRRNPL